MRFQHCILFCDLENIIIMNAKLEDQLKELMEQRDTVQSQLDNFRRVASDGNISDHTTRRWVLILIAGLLLKIMQLSS